MGELWQWRPVLTDFEKNVKTGKEFDDFDPCYLPVLTDLLTKRKNGCKMRV